MAHYIVLLDRSGLQKVIRKSYLGACPGCVGVPAVQRFARSHALKSTAATARRSAIAPLSYIQPCIAAEMGKPPASDRYIQE
jgi:hypothetical protein